MSVNRFPFAATGAGGVAALVPGALLGVSVDACLFAAAVATNDDLGCADGLMGV
jgi:hypothetical protein